MATKKIPARQMIFEVLDADGSTWLTVGGLTKIGVNLGEGEEKTDVTTYESAGHYETRKMQTGASLALEGFKMLDASTLVQDPGQARCEFMHGQLDESSVTSVRFRDVSGINSWTVWATAIFSLGEQGGGHNDMKSWSCTVTRSGASTTAVVS